MINTKEKVYFYDDRNKDKTILTLKEILFENKQICLCKVKKQNNLGVILFNIETGEVLSTEHEFWCATNEKD